MIEVFVFYGNGGVLNVLRNGLKRNRGTAIFRVNFVEKFLVSI